MKYFCRTAICIISALALCSCFWMDTNSTSRIDVAGGLIVLSALENVSNPEGGDCANDSLPTGISDAETAVALSARLPYNIGGQDTDESVIYFMEPRTSESGNKLGDAYLGKSAGDKPSFLQGAQPSSYAPSDTDDAKVYTIATLQKDHMIEIPVRVLRN